MHVLPCTAQVICEEAPEPKVYGQRTKQKQRFVAGIVTPAQPHYMYGLLDANMDPPLAATAPILAVAASAGGYKVAPACAITLMCSEGLQCCIWSKWAPFLHQILSTCDSSKTAFRPKRCSAFSLLLTRGV